MPTGLNFARNTFPSLLQYTSLTATLVYKDTNYSVPFNDITEFDCIFIFGSNPKICKTAKYEPAKSEE